MKGIVLAGGLGTRLRPITLATSKQLLPVYDKPMIYYPIATLMEIGIKQILVITTPHDQISFKRVLSNGSEWGIELSYEVQSTPRGIAEALIIGQDFIGNDSVALILGDNIFLGNQRMDRLKPPVGFLGAKIFAKTQPNLIDYGVIQIDSTGKPLTIEEKPTYPKGNHMIPGLYFFDASAAKIAKKLKPSQRDEIEITDLQKFYLQDKRLEVMILDDSILWFDAGTPESLFRASEAVRAFQAASGRPVGSPLMVAKGQGWL